MLKIISANIKIAHVTVILYILYLIHSLNLSLSYQVIALELGLTILNAIVRHEQFDFVQIIFSLSLTYTLIPNNYSYFIGLFHLKIIYIYKTLGEAIEQIFGTPTLFLTKLLKTVSSILKFTIIEYLFLALAMLFYKLFTLNDKEGVVVDDYLIMYKLIVTATTIGYGDVTPKTRLQIYFFTYTIPFICGSFVIYFNAVIPLFGEFIDLISGNSISSYPSPPSIEYKYWKKQDRQNFTNFGSQVIKRQLQDDQHQKSLGNNWILISAHHYEDQIPLINEIIKGDEPKQIKLKISSKIRKQYYPSGWTIIQANEFSSDLMMIAEGEVSTPQKKTKNYVFNQQGFFSKSPAKSTVVTNTFVVVWAISLADLQDIARSSTKVRDSINQKIGN